MIDKFARYWMGLTAVSLLLLTNCAQPTATPIVTATAVPATTTAPPTPTPEPTATPTLTAVELRDLRATAVLPTLPGYNPAHHDALLPLARHLWGESELVDPAEVTIVAGETAVRVNADASGSYPPGTLFVWRGAELLLVLPTAPDQTIEPGQATLLGETVQTWVKYDGAGQMVRFLHPDAAQWITPLDLSEAGDFSLFLAQEIAADGQPGDSAIWWASGSTAVELTTSPDPDQSLADYLAAPQLQLTETEGENGRYLVALANAQTGELAWTFDADTGQWHEAISPSQLLFNRAQELYGEPYGITLDPNVEVHPDGNMAIYAIVNGQRVEVVSTARDSNGNPVYNEAGEHISVFRTENYAMAISKPLAGGDLGTIKYVYDERLTPQLGEATLSIVPGRESQVQAWKDRILEIPKGASVINVFAPVELGGPYEQPKNHFLTQEEAEQITNIVFFIGLNTHEIPGFRPVYVDKTAKFGGDWWEEISVLWNPEQQNTLYVVTRVEQTRALDRTDPESWTFLSTIIQYLHAATQLQSGYRPAYGYRILQRGDILQEVNDMLFKVGGTVDGSPAFRINGLKQR